MVLLVEMDVKRVIHLHLLKFNNMNGLNIKHLIEMLGQSEITSTDLAIAKGKYEMPSNYKELKRTINIYRDGK